LKIDDGRKEARDLAWGRPLAWIGFATLALTFSAIGAVIYHTIVGSWMAC
jgi:hypothetical protein